MYCEFRMKRPHFQHRFLLKKRPFQPTSAARSCRPSQCDLNGDLSGIFFLFLVVAGAPRVVHWVLRRLVAGEGDSKMMNCALKMMTFVLKMMNSVLIITDFVSEMTDFVLKMMDFVLNMINLAGEG